MQFEVVLSDPLTPATPKKPCTPAKLFMYSAQGLEYVRRVSSWMIRTFVSCICYFRAEWALNKKTQSTFTRMHTNTHTHTFNLPPAERFQGEKLAGNVRAYVQ